MSEATILRDGARLSLVDTGGPGPAIIFQHGLMGDRSQPEELLPAAYPARRLTLECRGHGRSEAGDPARFSIATFADDVAAMAEERGVTRAVVGGVSMGAAIALRLAATRPALVRALVLVRPAWIDGPSPPNLAPNRDVGALLAAHDGAVAKALFMASPTHARLAAEAPDNLSSLMGCFDHPDRATASALLRAVGADGPGVDADAIAAIRAPTLVIGQDEDFIHPFAMAERLAGLIPGARLLRVTPKGRDKPRHLAEIRAAIDELIAGSAP